MNWYSARLVKVTSPENRATEKGWRWDSLRFNRELTEHNSRIQILATGPRKIPPTAQHHTLENSYCMPRSWLKIMNHRWIWESWCRDNLVAIFQASLNTLFNKKVWILTEISLKHIYKGLIYNTPGLFHITLGAEQATGHHLYDMYDMQLLFHNWAINNILFSDRWHILCTCIGRTNTYKCAILKYVGRWLLLDKNHCFALKKHIYYYQEIDEKQIMFACYFTHLWILV